MKSMTGHGWSEHAFEGHKISIDISSVNRKQGEISVALPRELDALEARIRDEINRRIARGRVTVRVSLHADDSTAASRTVVNASLARSYFQQLKTLGKELGLAGEVTLDTLVRIPGVLQSGSELHDAEHFWPSIQRVLQEALDALVGMREREGKHLAKDLEGRIGLMKQAVQRVKHLAPQVQERYRQGLIERIKAAGLDPSLADPDRITKEVVFFADRSDISEELTRLEAHFHQYESVIQQDQPVGRTLDFLAQEFNREINTLGAKANDSQISQDVVVLKTELEKFREQVQNVE